MQELSVPARIRVEVLAGLTVSLALVPEAVAFAFVAGVGPLVGLYAAFIVGLVTSVTGGRPGMISGATGALAVVMVVLVKEHGVEYLFLTVILMGIIQMAVGALKQGRLIRMVPYPVMLGFVNGLAIVIFLAQLESFKFEGPDGTESWLPGGELAIMLGLIAVTMAVIYLIPKFTTKFPSALAGILVVSAIVIFGGVNTTSVGDLSSISGGLPSFGVPDVPLNMETLMIILPHAFILAAIGLIESLLTVSLIDGITETKGQNNRECLSQGAANILTGFFGGMGGCAMIGQSMINMKSGARWRLSGALAALLLLAYILFASSLIERIPIAALVGVMFVVVVGTFSWSSLRIIRKVPVADAFVMILVSAVTVATDLAIAVIVGVIVSALVFAWNTARSIYVEEAPGSGPDRKIYMLHGQLFFASITAFRDLFHPPHDPVEVVIDFQHSRVWDHSGIEAIVDLARRYESADRRLHLLHLSENCQRILGKANVIIDGDPSEDPSYRVTVSGLGSGDGGH
ncbi:MAG TPA: SulP family inorganic anion transporter [Dehalococcoidia bacterium]|jgi:SulP family sulfate permease|nr:SulP family inorganic anion transporter [Dehalococcoidia bacterium]HIK88038.1 SulP family inorganic anion transporter [Dehalococcoidia bacterium]